MNVFKGVKDQTTGFFKHLPKVNPKHYSWYEWVVRSSLLVVLIFFVLISIQWAAGVFNYSVLGKNLFIDFHGYNVVGKHFLSSDKVLYWFSAWSRQNMFGVMWFAIWSGVIFTLLFLVFTNVGPAFLGGMFFIWFFLWIMAAYPAIRFTRELKTESHYWASIGLVIVFFIGLLLACIPLIGGIILIGDIIGLIANLASGAINATGVGMFIWMVVSAILAIVAIGFAIGLASDAFDSPLWDHNKSTSVAIKNTSLQRA